MKDGQEDKILGICKVDSAFAISNLESQAFDMPTRSLMFRDLKFWPESRINLLVLHSYISLSTLGPLTHTHTFLLDSSRCH